MAETRLREALEILRGSTWVQRAPNPSEGEQCALTAVSAAYKIWPSGIVSLKSMRECDKDTDALRSVIREQFGDNIEGAADFNDRIAKSFADIELVFEKAAIKREEEV